METSKQSAAHVRPGEGKTVWMVGTDLITFKATGEDTGGAYALFDSMVLPQGGPPPHIHHREDEAFYALEGEFEFLLEDRTVKAGVGSYIYVPRGTLHTLKNVGTSPGRLLTLVAPSGLDEYFEELGVPGDDISSPPTDPPDIEKLMETSRRYGIEIPPEPAG